MTPANPDALAYALAENDRLRAALANSGGPCAYCNLSREDWTKCQSGFPGCGRADDAMLCPHFGAEMQANDRADAAEARAAQLQAEVEALKGALKPFAEAAEAYGHSHYESQINERPAWAGKNYVEARLLAKHLRAARTALAARAATAREGQTHTPASGALKIEEADRASE
ncbi:hypothetical protein [Methylorubrum sp. GM97]|uniref:hypothetical protein n=1 Tax=Methylorubrum sp. GM97 TaxID=2938232 RepID=UPI00218AA6FD|nr:hypothetical protein [Methylorubrum sp. GM97]BDL41078.1 hypothetical protein MSPGM_36680 [Methylorubrum sp. GM97]